MASLVESGMKNLNFGDADSVGFFQMRVGIWNQGEYAGYPDKPELQVKWFLDNAESVKKARIASGKPIDDPNSYGDWIADVERPAEQYRGRYQTKLAEAQDLLKSRQAAPAAAARRRSRGGRPGRRRWQLARCRGAAGRPVPEGRRRGRQQHRPAGRPVPRRGQGRPGQPLVRLVRDLVAGEGRAQDAGRRLGRGRDLGAQRRAERQRPQVRQRRGGAAGRHRRLRLGRPERLRRRRPHRLPREQRQGRQVHRAGGQQRRQGQRRAADGRRRRQGRLHPRRGQRTARLRPRPARRRGRRRARRRPPPRSRSILRSSAARAPERVARRAPRRSRCSTTRTSCSTRSGSPTSRPAGSTRA